MRLNWVTLLTNHTMPILQTLESVQKLYNRCGTERKATLNRFLVFSVTPTVELRARSASCVAKCHLDTYWTLGVMTTIAIWAITNSVPWRTDAVFAASRSSAPFVQHCLVTITTISLWGVGRQSTYLTRPYS